MVWIFLSPEFPPNYHLFAWHFQRLGGIALGIGGTPYHEVPSHVHQSLTRYAGVGDLHHTEAVLAAARGFAQEFGKPNGVDSFNEYWLPLDAAVREALDILGPRPADLPSFQQKSHMKAYFQKAGIAPIPGQVAHSFADVENFIHQYGLPIIAKPDKGVGAGSTYKINYPEDIERFRQGFRPGYLLEKFITGTIQTFDGLTDWNGNILFAASLEYNRGIAEVVNEDTDIFYFVHREIPADLADAGRRVVAAYELKARFFHFEFIRTPEGQLYPLEVNMRPPGYPTLDMFNFAHDIDLYRAWAEMIHGHALPPFSPAPYYCCYIARKHHIGYSYTHEELLRHLGPYLVHHAPTNPLFRAAMGDYHYIIRTPDFSEMVALATFAQKRLTL
ncbi:MAG: carboxylate--amine ligase [Bacteroidia bacterium]|nr:carboxylate--amine ligase [Bacteroidia bacterium]MDW8235953.1 carboxylate--amine ligase [Bacteroidia bacterium]